MPKEKIKSVARKKNINAIARKKTTHALPVNVLARLRVYAAATNRDQQDIIAEILDKQLPENPFEESSHVA